MACFKELILVLGLVLICNAAFAAEDYHLEVSNGAWTNINEAITIHGLFSNMEGKSVNASFKGDIYFGAEKISEFQTESIMVGPGENFTFGYTFTPKNLGTYYAKGFVVYDNKLTDTQDSSFTTLSKDTVVPFATGFSIIALSVVVIGVLAVKIFINKKASDIEK